MVLRVGTSRTLRSCSPVAGKQSSDVDKALKLVAKGMTPYAAAKKMGIALSTIYRAMKRHAATKKT